MDNLSIYEKARSVPNEALKPITAGRLKGMSDINPMYRIKRLTELFGPCGIGWWYEITNKEIIFDEITNQKCAFVDVLLFVVNPESGEQSHGIPGTGGAAFVSQERSGPYMSDECYKMALTDAISVSAKALGIAADVYFAKDRTKYTANTETAPETAKRPTKCKECGNPISDFVKSNGEIWNADDIAAYTLRKYQKCLCADCAKKAKGAA